MPLISFKSWVWPDMVQVIRGHHCTSRTRLHILCNRRHCGPDVKKKEIRIKASHFDIFYFIYLFLNRSFRTFWVKMSMNTVNREKKLMARKDLAIMSSTYCIVEVNISINIVFRKKWLNHKIEQPKYVIRFCWPGD